MRKADPSDFTPTPQPGDLTVRNVIGGWSLERWDETGYWEPLGVYADFATADEIRRIASTNPDDDRALDGSTPNRAVPLSAFGYDNESDFPHLIDRGITEWL